MNHYYNAAGQRFDLPERPLEPPEDRIRAIRPWVSKSHACVNLHKETPASSAKADEGKVGGGSGQLRSRLHYKTKWRFCQMTDEELAKRAAAGLSSPRQIRFLEARGFQNVEAWSFDDAKSLIDRIAANGWKVPQGIIPAEYQPEGTEVSA